MTCKHSLETLLIVALSFQVNYYQLNFSPRFKLKIVPIQDSFQFRIEIIPRSIWHVNYFYGFRMTRGLSMMLMMMGQSDLRLIRHGLNDKIKWIICGLRLNNFFIWYKIWWKIDIFDPKPKIFGSIWFRQDSNSRFDLELHHRSQ